MSPPTPGDYDSWVKRTVLNPALSPAVFRARRATCSSAESELPRHGVVDLMGPGRHRRTATPPGAASSTYTGRKSGDLAHPLNVLMDCGLVRLEARRFPRLTGATYEIAEPLITFYHAVMRPIWSDLAHSREPLSDSEERSQPRFTANVLGPHFEQLCRHWTRSLSRKPPARLPARVEPGTVNDPGKVRRPTRFDVAASWLDAV